MNDNPAAVFLRRIPALLFCFVLCVSAAVFSARMLVPKAVPSQLLVRTPFRQLLAGGASEIGGTPPRPRAGFRDKIQWEVQQNFPFRISLLEAANRLPQLVGWNVPLLGGAGATSKFVVSNGFLCDAAWQSQSSFVAENNRILIMMSTLATKTPYSVFVMAPPRIQNARPFSGIFEFSGERYKTRIQFLENQGINVINLAPYLSDGTPYYRTDHHLTADAQLIIARIIAEKLMIDKTLHVDMKSLNDNAFDHVVYPAAFLGSYGKQVTLARCNPDDFSILTAKLPSRFRVEIPEKGIDLKGGGGILINEQCLSPIASYCASQYAAYGYANNGLIRITNLTKSDGPRLLFISDSHDNACITFLANATKEIVDIDLRYFTGSIDELFQDNSFDAIICFFVSTLSSERLSPFLSTEIGKQHHSVIQ